ncbi:MAG: hypothetical protein ABJB01_10680 [Rudaea sp.]
MAEKIQNSSPSKTALLLKLSIAFVFLIVMIVWQQYYFRAIDDVDASGMTLWNGPTIILIGIGIVASVVSLWRIVQRRRDRS